jgi:serine/threonine-protein kinase
LTGVPAFSGDQLDTILYRVVHETPPPPSERNRLVPPTLDQVVAKGLAKRPEQRYQSALEFATDLKRHKRKRLNVSATELASPAKSEIAKPQTNGDATVLISVGEAAAAAEPSPVTSTKRAEKARRRNGPVVAAAAVCAGIIVVAMALLWRKEPTVMQTAVPVAATSEPVTPPAVTAQATLPPVEQTVAEPTENLVPSTPPPPTPEAKPAVLPTVALARLTFAVSPWGEVYVDGKKHGVTPPLSELSIPAGKHTVEIRNAGLAPYLEQVDLLPDKTLKIKHKFQ